MSSAGPQSPMSAGSLATAIRALGESEEVRNKLIALLRDYERDVQPGSGFNAREEVTGPIIDAAIGHGSPLTKRLSSGLNISVRYTSKIVRDFLMSDDPVPDHVWEPQTTRALLELTRSARNVIIGGAYFGDHAVPIAHQIRDRGTVHCFEVSGDNVELLSLNARQNQLNNIRVNHLGLWSRADVRLTLSGDDSHATPSVAEAGDADTFAVTTIDAYGATAGLASVYLIMLDIEGGELEALRGAQRYLGMAPGTAPVVVFEIHGAYSDWSQGLERTEIIQFLKGFGYASFGIRDYHSNVAMAGRPVELVELDGIYIEGPPHGFNMLATKQPDSLNSAVFRRVRSVSPKLLFHRDPKLHAPLNEAA